MNKIRSNHLASSLFFSFLILFLNGCAHEVFSLNIEQNRKATIASELAKFCTGGDCVVDNCWAETSSLQVCTVKFNYVGVPAQEKILAETSNSLSKMGMTVGFCGRDLNNTLVVGAFFRSVGTHLVAGNSGEPPQAQTADTVMTDRQAEKTLNKSKNIMMNACESTPQKSE